MRPKIGLLHSKASMVWSQLRCSLKLTCGTLVLQKGIPPAALTSLTSWGQHRCRMRLTPASSSKVSVGLKQ